MEKLVLISNKCQDFLYKSFDDAWNCIAVNNIDQYFSDPRNLDLAGPHLLVICCEYLEYLDIKHLVVRNRPHEVEYRFLLHGSAVSIRNIQPDELHLIGGFFLDDVNPLEYSFSIQRIFYEMGNHIQMTYDWEKAHTRLIDTYHDQEDLVNIGRSLSIEKDQEKLLRMILDLSKKITGADAGSIYLVEKDRNGKPILRFKYSKTFSMEVALEEIVLDINKKSIAGYVAVTGEVLNIEDVYDLPPDAPYSFNAKIDEENNYRSKSMLVVPMKNYLGEIIGVIQLLNSKGSLDYRLYSSRESFNIRLTKPDDFDRYVTTFDGKYNNILESIAGQAGIAIENNRLIHQIENQFEQFVKASVAAIESRDPATSGHSFRVADMCKAMVYAINREREGIFAHMYFNENEVKEIELAALLHDFGKVYIDNSLFGKQKKLYPVDLQNFLLRIELLYRYTELEYTGQAFGIANGPENMHEKNKKLKLLHREKDQTLQKINKIKNDVLLLNEPTVSENRSRNVLKQVVDNLKKMHVKSIDGEEIAILRKEDVVNLSIQRGSLNESERKIMESHVDHTYAFVSKIPWPEEYKNIPEIALHHHERLDGSGYPDGLVGKESTSLQSRIMAVVDIFDALTSVDRRYKEALSIETSSKLLQKEAEEGRLDKDLVDLFMRYNIFDHKKRNNLLRNNN